jgi:H+/Cl- antiporter ClcA
VAAIVLSATLSDIVVDFGLQHTESFSLQGNYYAMLSPLFELPLYLGLGLVCGLISVFFSNLKEFYAEIFNGNDWADALPIAKLPSSIKPLIGGIICGFVAVFYPQTIFAGYSVLDGIISGKTTLDLTLLLQLLFIKIQLSALSMGSGLIGGIFAPALFFGATAGSAYHCVISSGLSAFHALIDPYLSAEFFQYSNRFLTIANSPAYATVGAAATLGAMFRAPLTSSMLLFELTQNHDIVLPVLAATGLAGLFAEIISSTFATATAAATSEEFISTHAELTSTTDEISSM